MTADRYQSLHEKYLRDGERLLANGDYVQASEKFWGAVATMVKAVAAERGWRHNGHAELRGVARNVALESGDEEILTLFNLAERLHANFYENFLAPEAVESSAGQVLRVVAKLQVFREGKGDVS